MGCDRRIVSTISVVIPAFNRPNALRRALGSIASQTMLPLEVIVCDDGSEPDLRLVVESFQQKGISLQYLRIENSGGPARPRNIAIEAASGTWVAFLDSDDWWTADRLEIVAKSLNQTRDMLYHKLRVVEAIGASGGKVNRRRQLTIGQPMGRDVFEHLTCIGNAIPTSTVIARRSVLLDAGGFREEPCYRAVEDFELWIRLARRGARIGFLDAILGWYSTGDGISVASLAQMERHRLVLKSYSDCAPDTQRTAIEARINYVDATYLLGAGQPGAALRSLRRAGGLVSRNQRFVRWIKMGQALVRTASMALSARRLG